jgi:hypothetical protein
MEPQGQKIPPFRQTNTLADPAMSREAQRIFEALEVGLDAVKEGPEWRELNTAQLSDALSNNQLTSYVIEQGLSRGSWRVISEVLHSEFSLRCLPSVLLTNSNFSMSINSAGRALSDDEAAKVGLWRSVLLSSLWKWETLNAYEREAWGELSFKVYDALAHSSLDACGGSDPGQIVHVVDVVNCASCNVGTARQSMRVTVQEAFQGLVDCLSQVGDRFSLNDGPLAELDLSLYKRDAGFRKSLVAGVLKSQSKDTAERFLFALVTQPGVPGDWMFRVSIAESLIAASDRPISVCFSLLESATDTAVLSLAIENVSRRLAFPLGKNAKGEVAQLGASGGEVLGNLLVCLDSSHARSGWFNAYPRLVQQYAQCCAVAHVPHGLSVERIEMLSQTRGGPLSEEQVWVALSALDSFSAERIATKIRVLLGC